MERFLVDPDLVGALAGAGVAGADDLLALGAAPPGRSLKTRVPLALPGTSGLFHLKRYHYAGWRESRHLLGHGTLFGTPPELREFRALAWLRAHGIPAVRPVAAAALTRRGRLVAHALLTEHVPDAPDLAAHLADPAARLRRDAPARQGALAALGRSLRAMHLLGFAHRDCHLRNVLLRLGPDDRAEVWWLDCRRGGVGGWRRGPEADAALLRRELLAHLGPDELAAFEAAYGL